MSEDSARPWAEPPVGDATFDAYYYANCCGVPCRRDEHWTRFFGQIADHIVSGIQPGRVLDAGCGLGLLVEALRSRGVDARGVDLSSYAIANVTEPMKPFCAHGSIADEFADRYDLIVSIEVVEHMPALEAEQAVANMCRHADDVLFSSSPIDHREPSHVNVQPPEHWAELFARQGFYRDVDFDASFITPWAVRFRRSSEPLPRIVRGYERRCWALRFESTEARAFALDVQRKFADASERLSAADGRFSETDAKRIQAERELALGQNQLADVQNQLADVQNQLAHVRAQLAHAAETVKHMERSAFWKLRLVWVAIARLAGRAS